MKTIKQPCLFILLLNIATVWMNESVAQESNKEVEIKNLIDSQNYVFKAQTALPTGARTRQLNYDYDLKVTKDAVVSYLPYFGRAYSATPGSTTSSLEFTAKDFEYTITENKKGSGWDIVIKPKDVQQVRELFLTAFKNGNANLRVTSNDRQNISFSGYITANKPKKDK